MTKKKPVFKSGKKKKFSRKVSVPKVVKSYVKRQIDKNQEDKFLMKSYFNGVTITPATGTLPLVFDLTPSGSDQGAGVSDRIGTKIRIKAAYFNWRFFLSGASQTSASDMPLYLFFMIARPRSSQNSVTTTETDQLFYSADNTLQCFDSGDSQSQWFLPNRDFWDVRYWTRRPIKLGSASGSGTANYANNEFVIERSGVVNMSKIYNKIVRFNNTGTVAQGNNWYAIYFVQKFDYTVSTTNWDPPAITAQLNIKYEDS